MAAPTLTSKLGLLVDPDGESLIGSQGANWGIVDQAAGVIHVNQGANSPLLYSGCPVAEKTTDIAYTLVDNGAGGFNKRYTTYPYIYSAYSAAASAGTAASYINWGWTTLNTQSCVNNKPADQEIGGGAGWFVPVKGLYALSAVYRWFENSDNVLKCAVFSINNNDQFYTEKRRLTMGGPACIVNINTLILLNAGDVVRGKMINAGAAASLYTSFYASLVRAVI